MKRMIATGAVVGAALLVGVIGCESESSARPDNSTWGYSNDAAYRNDQATSATGAPLKHTLKGPTVGGEDAMEQARGGYEQHEMPAYGIDTTSDIGRSVVGPDGQVLGTVSDTHGTVIDAGGDQIGRVVDQSGTVVDLNGNRIGSVAVPQQPQPLR